MQPCTIGMCEWGRERKKNMWEGVGKIYPSTPLRISNKIAGRDLARKNCLSDYFGPIMTYDRQTGFPFSIYCFESSQILSCSMQSKPPRLIFPKMFVNEVDIAFPNNIFHFSFMLLCVWVYARCPG